MANKPVIDLRIYTIRPRGMPEYLKLFEELALPVALKHLGEPLGYYVTQIGPLNQVVHLWRFDKWPIWKSATPPSPAIRISRNISPQRRVWNRAGRPDHATGRIQKPVLARDLTAAPSVRNPRAGCGGRFRMRH
jgi:hypothetical protein